MQMSVVFCFVVVDIIGEDEVDGWMRGAVPLKKLDLPSPFLPRITLMWGLRLFTS